MYPRVRWALVACAVLMCGFRLPLKRPESLIGPTAGRPAFHESSEATVQFSADVTEAVREGDSFIKRYRGNVVMWMNPEVWLRSSYAVYNGMEHMAELGGRVSAVDSGRTLNAQRMMYLFKEHEMAGGRPVVHLIGRVSVSDSAGRVTCLRANYWPESDSVVAYRNVRAEQSGVVIFADTLSYDTRNGDMYAVGNVQIADSTEDITISCGEYQFDGVDSIAVVTRQPVLVKGSGDTSVVVSADSMRLEQKSERAVAWDSVRVVRGNLWAQCDSVSYDSRDELLMLFGAPRAVQRTEGDSGSTESTADGRTMVLYLDGTAVQKIRITGDARAVATEFDSLDQPSGERWIAGREITFHVDGEEVTQVDVSGQATSRYLPPPAARTSEGINEASGDSMTITFSGSKMSRVRLKGGVQGIFWPPVDSLQLASAEPDTTQVDMPVGEELPDGD